MHVHSARSGSCCLQPCSQRMSGVGKLRYKSVGSTKCSRLRIPIHSEQVGELDGSHSSIFFTQSLSTTRLSSGQISESSSRPPPPTFGQVTWWSTNLTSETISTGTPHFLRRHYLVRSSGPILALQAFLKLIYAGFAGYPVVKSLSSFEEY